MRNAVAAAKERFARERVGWDLRYNIGVERIFIQDHRGLSFSPGHEYLLMRLDSNGRFHQWSIIGCKKWASTVGSPGNQTYSRN
jgi:hypothetical protein